MNSRGFTLIELAVILVIISVLAVTAFARLGSRDAFDARGVRDELASAFRLAQRYALTSGCETQVTVNAGGYSVLMENTPCGSGSPTYGTTISSPSGAGTLSGSFSGVTISPTGNHVYDAYGDLSAGGASITVTAGGNSAGFTVHSSSGFVDLP